MAATYRHGMPSELPAERVHRRLGGHPDGPDPGDEATGPGAGTEDDCHGAAAAVAAGQRAPPGRLAGRRPRRPRARRGHRVGRRGRGRGARHGVHSGAYRAHAGGFRETSSGAAGFVDECSRRRTPAARRAARRGQCRRPCQNAGTGHPDPGCAGGRRRVGRRRRARRRRHCRSQPGPPADRRRAGRRRPRPAAGRTCRAGQFGWRRRDPPAIPRRRRREGRRSRRGRRWTSTPPRPSNSTHCRVWGRSPRPRSSRGVTRTARSPASTNSVTSTVSVPRGWTGCVPWSACERPAARRGEERDNQARCPARPTPGSGGADLLGGDRGRHSAARRSGPDDRVRRRRRGGTGRAPPDTRVRRRTGRRAAGGLRRGCGLRVRDHPAVRQRPRPPRCSTVRHGDGGDRHRHGKPTVGGQRESDVPGESEPARDG